MGVTMISNASVEYHNAVNEFIEKFLASQITNDAEFALRRLYNQGVITERNRNTWLKLSGQQSELALEYLMQRNVRRYEYHREQSDLFYALYRACA
jgi:hypothetical protein